MHLDHYQYVITLSKMQLPRKATPKLDIFSLHRRKAQESFVFSRDIKRTNHFGGLAIASSRI